MHLGAPLLALLAAALAADPCALSLEGHVTDDAFHDAVPGVRVSIDGPGGAHAEQRADDDGFFHFHALCPGPWQLHAEADFHDPIDVDLTLPVEHVHLELHGDYEVVEVETSRHGVQDAHATAVIDGAALERARGQDLAEVASQVPGVVVLRGSADASQPIIRGQSGRRLQVLQDGVRHESQKWGSDHGTEVDPFTAGSLTVVKGAAGVRFGPDAIGGALLVDPPPLPDDPGVGGDVWLVGASNGRKVTAAAQVEGAHATAPGFAWRLNGSYARGAAQKAPGYALGNTGSELGTAGVTLGWRRGTSGITATWRHYDLRAGVFRGVRADSPDALADALAAGQPRDADLYRVRYAIERPYQRVSHDLALLRGRVDIAGAGLLEATYSYQHNHRQEFDTARAAVTGPQYDFTLRTHDLQLRFEHRAVHLGRANLEGEVGVTGTFQENVYRGLPLVPSFRAFSVGVHALERVWTRHVHIELGARYDHLSQTAFLTDDAVRRHTARGTLAPDACTAEEGGARCPLAFDTGSVTLGAVAHAIPDVMDLRVDLSSASRFPDADELYLNGPAPTQPVYAVGDPGLGVETTWGASATLGVRHPWTALEVSAFASYVQDYIYFAPDLAADGSIQVDVLIRGAFPRFSFRALDAVFHGVDARFDVAPTGPLGATVTAAIVRGQDAATGAHLVGVPADRVGATLTARLPDRGLLSATSLSVDATWVDRQRRVATTADLAPPPAGYALLGATVATTVDAGGRPLGLSLTGTNLTNRTYREYTSLNRYFADEPGVDVTLRLSLAI